jgi:hypothetical protein
MDITEVDSFIQKFKQLWKSGYSAHLDLDTHSGKAWVGLRVRLGHVPGPFHHQVQQPRTRTRDSPSRQRRRARRAAARKENAKEAVGKSTEAEEANASTIAAEKAAEDSKAEESIVCVAAEEATVNDENKQVSDVDDFDETAVNGENITETFGETEKQDENEGTVDASNIVDEICPDEVYNNEEAKSANIVVVHAVATFENSPNDTLGQDDIISLQKYIHSEEHLQRNISKVELQQISRWEVSTKLFVLTNNLWEGPRSYVWKHLGGQNFWDRSNGTKIKLVKIHVK